MNSRRLLSFLIQYPMVFCKKLHSCRLLLLVMFLGSFFLCFFYTISVQSPNDNGLVMNLPPTHIFYPNSSLRLPLASGKNHSYQTVLLWNDLFDSIHWHQPAFFNTSTIVSCSATHQCLFTRDKQQLSHASIVAFHLYNMKRFELPERTWSRNVNQHWIFVTGESPINFYYNNPSLSPYVLDNYFDRSISYKFDSSYPVFAPIFQPRQISSTERQDEQNLNLQSLKLKNKPILWFVSNCATFSQREKFVEELNQFLAIDIYGQCGKPCSTKSSDRPCPVDLNDYYFYLSFENSRCHSYITEKFWNIISDKKHRLVPIVMGADEKDYEHIAPKHSFIHVNQYPTAKDLANYLEYLMANPEKYLEYFQWREHTDVQVPNPGRWMSLLCPLCQMAENVRRSSGAPRMNFSSWYNPKVDCHENDVQIFSKCKRVDMNDLMSWTYNIRCP